VTVALCDGPKGWTPAVRADIECGVRDRKLESTGAVSRIARILVHPGFEERDPRLHHPSLLSGEIKCIHPRQDPGR
jgi:hypothetical protein